jgi:hypothetical protein
MNIKDLLKTNVAEFKAPPRFPAGLYEMVIVQYELLPFYWKKSNVHGLAYVPTFKAISSIEADDASNPELADQQQKLLADFGDWTKKEFCYAYMDRNSEPPRKVATVSEVNFPLIETDAEGNGVGMMENMAWRFYLRENQPDGSVIQSGFVHDKLGLDYPDGAELEQIFEDTVNQRFLAQLEYEVRMNDPTRSDLVVKATMATG